jgi:NAD(P)-dependent dehydrogenase (short-subunit alcohol dehydrogenase family)
MEPGHQTLGQPGVRQAIIAPVPLAPLAKAEGIARVARFLVREQASFVTGSLISVNGGFGMR